MAEPGGATCTGTPASKLGRGVDVPQCSRAGGSGSLCWSLWVLVRVVMSDDTVSGWLGSPQAVENT